MAIVTKAKKLAKENVTAMVHIPMTPSQKAKLDEMAAADRRSLTDFMRILVEDEYDRRQKAAEVSGATA
jgi:hypothetical protein